MSPNQVESIGGAVDLARHIRLKETKIN